MMHGWIKIFVRENKEVTFKLILHKREMGEGGDWSKIKCMSRSTNGLYKNLFWKKKKKKKQFSNSGQFSSHTIVYYWLDIFCTKSLTRIFTFFELFLWNKKLWRVSFEFQIHDTYLWAWFGDLIVRFMGRFTRNFKLN